MAIWVIFALGVLAGGIAAVALSRGKCAGILCIDIDDNLFMHLELEKDVADVCQRKYVLLKIRREKFGSRK